MKIKRPEDKKKKELTDEEKELRDLKKAKNIGLASMGVGGIAAGIGRFKNNTEKYPSMPEISEGARKMIIAGGIGTAASGLALHGISAIKYRKLKKKLDSQKKEEEDKGDDNSKK